MRFPVKVRFRKAEARIYGKSKAYPFYRVCGMVDGKRRMTSFRLYGEAKAAADKLVRDIASGSRVAALTRAQANDALIALARLDGFFRATGKRVSLADAADSFCTAAAKLGDRALGDAVDGFLSNVATVKRMDLGQAVEQFIEGREPKTVAKDGKRPQLSEGYAYNVAMWAREFAHTLPGLAVCDLAKELLNTYMAQYAGLGVKSRNERRNVVRMFLKWCVRQDYLAANHRLLEADGMAPESYEPESIEFYSPAELSGLLQTASEQPKFKELLPVIALCGLAGLRLQEAARLTWVDVFHVAGHVEISAAKSKTRARRLVTTCPALAQWLEPYRACEGRLWPESLPVFHRAFNALLERLEIPVRRNGLRHGFVSYHLALYANENLTAAEAGNSPAMIHGNYKGLATKKEAEKWFAVAPERAANVIQLATANQQ